MNISFRAAAWLTATLILTATPGWAQAQDPQPPSTQPQAEPPAPKDHRESERKRKKTPRRSSRQAPSSSQGAFDEGRPSRDPGPTREDLTLTAQLLGGYDDNLTGGLGSGAGTVPTAMVSGSTVSADAGLAYSRGNNLRSVQADATGTLQEYPGYIDHPVAGGTGSVSGRTRAGRSLTLSAAERLGYEPFFNVFSPGAASAPLPPGIGAASPVTGLYERRSWNSSSTVSAEQRWGRRDWTTVSYSYNVQQFTTDAYGNTRTNEARVEHRRGLSPGARLRGEYRYVDRDYTASDGSPLPTREHRIEAGPEIDKALSRRQHVRLSFAAGGAYLESVNWTTHQPWTAWVPTGSATARLGLSENWSLDAAYRRDFTELRGVTDQVYTTDTASVSTGGLVGRRTELRLGGSYSNWMTPLASGASDTLHTYGASVTLRVRVTDKLATNVQYYYYRHRFSDPAVLPAGFPPQYDRNSVRVGLSVWVPLKGASTSSSSAPTRPPS